MSETPQEHRIDDFCVSAPLSDTPGTAWTSPPGSFSIQSAGPMSHDQWESVEVGFTLVAQAPDTDFLLPTGFIGFPQFGGEATERTFFVTVTAPDGTVTMDGEEMTASRDASGNWRLHDFPRVAAESTVRISTT